MERLRDPARVHVVVHIDRVPELGVRVHAGVLAVGDSDSAQALLGRAVFVHVPARDHGVAGGRAE